MPGTDIFGFHLLKKPSRNLPPFFDSFCIWWMREKITFSTLWPAMGSMLEYEEIEAKSARVNAKILQYGIAVTCQRLYLIDKRAFANAARARDQHVPGIPVPSLKQRINQFFQLIRAPGEQIKIIDRFIGSKGIEF